MSDFPRILITGAGGFTGRWLISQLRSQRHSTLIGLGRALQAAPSIDEHYCCDLTNPKSVLAAVAAARPQIVFHLAGCNAFSPPEEIERVNVGGFRNLCQALRSQTTDRPIRLLTIGSAAELGHAGAARLPVDEDACCYPESIYGQSKWTVTQQALAAPSDDQLEIIVARPFNLVGPGLDARLSLGSFAAQLAAIAVGQASSVQCGALDTRRDYIDIRDAVAAYVALADTGQPGHVYHVCSGRSHQLGDLLEQMMDAAGQRVPVIFDPARIRNGDLADIYGNHGKLTRDTGWQPRIPLEASLADLMAAAKHVHAAARQAA